jgi:CO dehydrogenase/acetyl-CoA synthase gamma subunit (corrinoid Fe-S protein)
MIALTVSDLTDAQSACLRVSSMMKRRMDTGIPDAICIRNDSFSEELFSSMVELVSSLWSGDLILESDIPSALTGSVVSLASRRPMIVGANSNNLEEFCTIASTFGCPLCISSESLEDLLDLVQRAGSQGVTDVILDPMMKNMKQCLEMCTDIGRLAESLPEAAHPVAVRTWSGEYAMTMATVSLLTTDAIVIMDDLDTDCCETLGSLLRSVR